MINGKKTGFIVLGGIMVVACSTQEEWPNIVYVFPDQFRNCSLSFWNDPEYEGVQGWVADPSVTPNINAFAGESIVLSRVMSTCPVSSPHRGMLLSGMYPERNGVVLNCMSARPFSTLDSNAVCLSDVLSANGYSCGYIGKLHVETPMKNDPGNPGCYVEDREPKWDAYTPQSRRHGFSYWYSYGTFDVHKNPHYWDTQGCRHDPCEFSVKHETDKAIEYLRNEHGERDGDKPFFMCVAYNPPHSPYESIDDCMEEDFNLYKDKSLRELYVRDNADTTLEKAPSIRYYLANVTAVDREFGRIVDELRALGLEKNTIVVFTSDHGETMCSHSTVDPKNSIWTESFNVPFIVRYPGILQHRVDSLIMTTPDIMPTLLSLCGLADRIPDSVEGKDLSAVIMGVSDMRPEAALYIRNEDGRKDADGIVLDFFPVARGIRTDRYTFEIDIRRDYTLKGVHIFDDISDPYQMNDLYGSDPKLFQSLLATLRTKLEEADDTWHRENIIERIINKDR